MGKFKLTYFNVKGRAELIRLIFAKTGTKFDEERIEFDQWPDRKASMPMGQLPLLEYKGHQLIQSLTIARFVARKCGLAGKEQIDDSYCDQFVTTLWVDILNKLVDVFMTTDEEEKARKAEELRDPITQALERLAGLVKGEFVLGSVMSYADLALLDVEPWIARSIPEIPCPANFKDIVAKVEKDKKIAAYIANRPNTPF